ncbi:alpha/beta hydrolase family protein [Subtercola boreus]|nr:alpha/beta fold hydrolase [Subtercola boreus]
MTRQDGELGLLYDDESQHAVLGPILNIDRDARVERSLAVAPGSTPPLAGTFARPIGNVFATAQAVSPDAREVTIDTAYGVAPAWLFPGTEASATTWAIHIHGSLSGRDGAFRSVQSLFDTGFTSLVPSMRGDGDGPPAPRGAFTLGQTEWLDIENALDYAAHQGAEKILLIGWSSGASIALRLAFSSKHDDLIGGLILIAPVISWRNSIRLSSKNFGVPKVIADASIWALGVGKVAQLLGSPEPLRFSELDWSRRGLRRKSPVLVLHSDGDTVASYEDSKAFEKMRRDYVTLTTFTPAVHALEWNANPIRFSNAIRRWVKTHR